MLDPFRVTALEHAQGQLSRIAEATGLWALPLHAHEVLFAVAVYTFIDNVVSPTVSAWLLPNTYPKFDYRTKINWNIHVVSFVQACIVNAMSLYLIFYDEERKLWTPDENWDMRIWGYTGLTGFLQSFALGYFLWDFYISVRWVEISGWGMVVHAIASTAMFTLGFRPFIHYYCPIFLLHELSTPFLNIHWFCDKLDLTGSIYQAINGALLTVTFFGCRLVWGTYGAIGVSRDVWRATFTGVASRQYPGEKMGHFPSNAALESPTGQTTAFMKAPHLPTWLGVTYLAANIALMVLNVFWFSKMIETIRKRFDPPFGTRRAGADKADGKNGAKKKKS